MSNRNNNRNIDTTTPASTKGTVKKVPGVRLLSDEKRSAAIERILEHELRAFIPAEPVTLETALAALEAATKEIRRLRTEGTVPMQAFADRQIIEKVTPLLDI